MKSMAIVWNGSALCVGVIGAKGARLGWVLTLFLWQLAHPLM